MPLSKWPSLSHVLKTLFISAGLAASASPALAVDVQPRPDGDGYIVRPAPGESVSEAVYAILQRRRAVNVHAQPGDQDIVEMGPGYFSMTDALGNRVWHYRSGGEEPVFPPLVIRGAGADSTTVTCTMHRLDSPCAGSDFGLVIEDLSLATNGYRSPVAATTNADLVLRRVRLVGQSLPLPSYRGVFGVFNGNLTIEDSVFSDNWISGGEGLIAFGKNRNSFAATVRRSMVAGNSAVALFDLSLYQNAVPGLRLEQSTVVDNQVGHTFRDQHYSGTVTVSRSIVDDLSTQGLYLAITDSFTGPDSELFDDGRGLRIPLPDSPVVDGLPCNGPGVDQRGLPTGVPASYLPPSADACDYGAVEAQHGFCMATDRGTVACADGEISVADVASLGCRLVSGLLDCGGGQEAELVGSLGPGASLLVDTAELLMQTDGNLVLYDDGVARWSSQTAAGACIGHTAAVQGDGSLAVLDAAGTPCFSTGVGGDRVVVRQGFVGDPARLVIERADGSPAWTTVDDLPTDRAFALPGTRIPAGDSLAIPGARAEMGWDGNFVLYDTIDGSEVPVWSFGNEACAGRDALFTADGSLLIGEPGTTCEIIVQAPGSAVLRLHRTPLGAAVLTWLTPLGRQVEQRPQVVAPNQCSDLPADSPDGIHTVVDRYGSVRQVYCDMTNGGWMLVGKVYNSHHGSSNLPEPADWWTAGTGQVGPLTPGPVDWPGGLGYAAYGSAWLADLDLGLARFDVIAEHADAFTDITEATPGQTGTWYKDPSTIATWFTPADTVPSAVCPDATLGCGLTGRILDTGDGVWLERMILPNAGGAVHLRPDTDARPQYDGVCSYTFNLPSWLDSAAEHWGNGLDIWVKGTTPGPRKCTDLPAASPDGVYTVVDGAGVERQVFCDMTNGGYMLVGKVYRSHHGRSGIPEPADWWTAGTGRTDALVPGVVEWTSGLGYAAYGSRWLAGLGLSVARFDVIAEDATPFARIADAVPGQTASWYKDASTIGTWFSPDDLAPTAVCPDEALSCPTTGRVLWTPEGTWLEGMRLPTAGGNLHLRPDNDNLPGFDGLCSYTGDSPLWLDDAAGHWGNALNIWVK